ncbi:MAG: RNA polymerase sigma factor [Lachnospiraceae bacterium]|nr:RNA polymerase sigma factor [Lachnospiraceae bacterium]
MKQLLEELFTQYYKAVYSYLYSLCRNAGLSEDLASEVFLEVVTSIGSFRGEADIKTWLFSIARHKWYHHLRKKSRQADTELLTEFLPSTGKTPEDTCYDSLLVQRIYELLEDEPERTQSIVNMRLEGYSFYEIGTKHGISESSARVIDFRAKAKIRRQLEKEGFEHD